MKLKIIIIIFFVINSLRALVSKTLTSLVKVCIAQLVWNCFWFTATPIFYILMSDMKLYLD